jgi:protein-S-isoprenylcysteine O-methyltransferase Ste14
MPDFVRYLLALLMLMALPCAILYWFLIHPFATFWRRVGGVWANMVCAICLLAVCAAIFVGRDALLNSDWDVQWLLVVAGVVLIATGMYFEFRCRVYLNLSTLLGAPEKSASQYPGKLLRRGIYSQVRHPRYIAAAFVCMGIALILNYPLLYLFSILFIVMLYPLILVEERELVQRFGEAYRDYARATPRLIPRWFQRSPNDNRSGHCD